MSLLGASRYGVAEALGSLSAVQELLNTASAGNPRLPDLLTEGRVAGTWLREARSAATGVRPAGETYIPTEPELRKLRELRASLAASVSGRPAVPQHASVRLGLDSSGRVDAIESNQPVAWLVSTVLVEIMLAQRSGEWNRLKICGNPDCDVAFFDRSKSRTGVWHDVRACGNAINLRASRSRRGAEGQRGVEGRRAAGDARTVERTTSRLSR